MQLIFITNFVGTGDKLSLISLLQAFYYYQCRDTDGKLTAGVMELMKIRDKA
jgi:hypothetical protein